MIGINLTKELVNRKVCLREIRNADDKMPEGETAKKAICFLGDGLPCNGRSQTKGTESHNISVEG